MAARSFTGAAVMQKGNVDELDWKQDQASTIILIYAKCFILLDVVQDLFIKELKAYKPQPVVSFIRDKTMIK